METRRDTFQAIADPTRRAIIDLVSRQPMNLNAIAAHFSISRPAISKQMKVLEECGLVQVEEKGRERYCSLRIEKLFEVSEWIEQYKREWNSRLDALERYLEQVQQTKKAT